MPKHAAPEKTAETVYIALTTDGSQANAAAMSQGDPHLQQPAAELADVQEDALGNSVAADEAPEDGMLGDSMLSVDALRISGDDALLTAPGLPPDSPQLALPVPAAMAAQL